MNRLRRFLILKHWLCGKKNGVSLIELVKNVFEPTSDIMAKRMIKEVKEDGGYWKVYFRDIKDPLFYPKEMPLHSLYQIVKEEFYPGDWNYYEIEQTRVTGEDVVADCGAAEGLFSFLVAHKCRRVYAIEPLPQFVESMKLSFSNMGNVEIIPCALSDKKGKGRMSDNNIMSSLDRQEGGTVEVNIDTIDDLFYRKGIKISYLKADIEGYEMKMLEGAFNTIKTCGPKIAIATYHKPEDAGLITAFLKNINPDYRIKLKGVEGGFGAPVMLHAWMD